MKLFKGCVAGLFLLLSLMLAGTLAAQDASVTVNSACSGTRFNLEPRLNANPQNSESVDFLPNRVSAGVDLVVGAGSDGGPSNTRSPRLGGDDGYYVHRAGDNCSSNFEGTLSTLSVEPTVVADAARDSFFLADEVLSVDQLTVEVARTTAANLLSTTTCPSGSQINGANPKCWPVIGVANFNPGGSNSAFLLHPYMAVDPRTTGTGAGDVYVVTQFLTGNVPNTANVRIIACTNQTVTCGAPLVVSGTDTFGSYPFVQVRHDGTITISYWTLTKPSGTNPNPIDIKFVTCKPQGAPKAPVCETPTLVATSNLPNAFAPADSGFTVPLFPKHANRMESDGTFTTFLVYDRCHSIAVPAIGAPQICSKVDVVVTFSTNNGATWSAPVAVETGAGHQFFGTIRNDVSTQTINLAYYSTQDDVFLEQAKLRLRQIAPGSTVLGAATLLTAATDPDAGLTNLNEHDSIGPTDFGDRIGLAAAGTGTAGQSRVYAHYTSTNVFGTFNGVSASDQNNTLTSVSY